MSLVGVEFEVFGQVQGVFFRKYTESAAKKIGVRGWISSVGYFRLAGGMGWIRIL